MQFFRLFGGWFGDDFLLLAEGALLGFLLLFEFGGCSFDTLIFGKDILSHGDPELIILIFMQGVILEIFDILDLEDIFLLEILVVLLLLDHFLVRGINKVVCELVPPDVDEVDDINDQHGKADDQNCQGVVEEMGV